MYVHTRFSTWVTLGLIVVSGGLWGLLAVGLKQVDKYTLRLSGADPTLCDCCGSYHPATDLRTVDVGADGPCGKVCDRGADASSEKLRYAFETPMWLKYVH